MNAYTNGELDTFGLLQMGMQVFYLIKDSQGSAYSSLGVVFMGLGIAKIHQETIPKELSDMSFIALDDFSADFLVSTYYFPIVFWIKEAGELGRLYQITKHHSELPSF